MTPVSNGGTPSIRPYYEDDFVTLYQGDCREILPEIAPIPLIVTDPPYGIGEVYGVSHDDSAEAHWEWFREALTLMRSSARQVVFTHRQAALRELTDWDHLCAWHKPFNLTFSIQGWQAKWEPIFVYGGQVTRLHEGARRPSSVDSWAFNTVPSEFGHPREKPVPLMRELIACFDGWVCDPFAGSGTTLRAAKDLGRPSIGIEIEERWCEAAARRCSQEVLAVA